jgi:BirA family biotin operon repressor/biotin-[acetyl-CoA-carboxylase] ligase
LIVMVDRIELERVLKDLPLGPVRYFASIESTNSEAARWVDNGAPDMALVAADEQTAGRGRQGRQWFTPAGAALAFSLILRNPGGRVIMDNQPENAPAPSGRLDAQAQVAAITALGALAVSQALEQRYALSPEIKWPNDVLLENRKVCGILAEAHWQAEWLAAVVLGIGINVAPASVPADKDLLYPATSVESVLGRPVDRLELLHAVLERLVWLRTQMEPQEIIASWDERLAFRGKPVRVFTGTALDQPADAEGEIIGLDQNGCLRLRLPSGAEHTVCTGELRLRPAN